MKKIGKALLFLIIVIILIAIIAVGYVTLALPNVGAPEDIKIALTSQRITRGAYLANNVSMCMDCHSQRDWSQPPGPVAADKFGAGGEIFDSGDGFPGQVQLPNITPYNLKNWTDGEIFRALTTGERKNGSAIFPIMPWDHFAKMSREDVYSIIAYLRTVKPIATLPYSARKLDFPVNILVNTMPEKAGTFGETPPVSDTLKYGAYMINAAACDGCHSPRDHGNLVPGMAFAGGMKFMIGKKAYYSSNITPDKETGIGKWTSDDFVEFFKAYTDSAQKIHPVKAMVMPVYDYSGMNVTDLKAIYAYLRTVKAVSYKVPE